KDRVTARLIALAEAQLRGEPVQAADTREFLDEGQHRLEVVLPGLRRGQTAVARPALQRLQAGPPERDQFPQAIQHAPVRQPWAAVLTRQQGPADPALDQET